MEPPSNASGLRRRCSGAPSEMEPSFIRSISDEVAHHHRQMKRPPFDAGKPPRLTTDGYHNYHHQIPRPMNGFLSTGHQHHYNWSWDEVTGLEELHACTPQDMRRNKIIRRTLPLIYPNVPSLSPVRTVCPTTISTYRNRYTFGVTPTGFPRAIPI
ncbi:hypothetical protein LWI29_010279 [Acer saccharum]|uniref:Uncharacterized protein n=1 Tax=Acer saccharum TaxID=4024 RepID=A0AA39SKK7_ACESA|nr:hypothetical protein LWI29_010279 [Acer saccharum]